MTIQQVIAAPYIQRGKTTLSEQEIVVALSLHRDWFSPAQASAIVERAEADGLIESAEDGLSPTFELDSLSIPADFSPDESIMNRRSAFELMLEEIVAHGIEKQEAVGEINRMQRDLDLTIAAAAALYAAKHGISLSAEIDRAKAQLESVSP